MLIQDKPSLQEALKAQEGRLMGALLRVPFLAVVERIYTGIADAGFDDITYAHLAVFRHVDERAGSRLTDLADEAQITKQSMSYLVDQLEAGGYVERVPDPADGRARLIRLTARGGDVMQTARTQVITLENEWDDYLGHEEMNTLRNTLKVLVTMLESKSRSG